MWNLLFLALADLGGLGAVTPHAPSDALLEPTPSLSDMLPIQLDPDGWRNFVEVNGATFRERNIVKQPGSLALDSFGISWDLEHRADSGNVLAFGVDYQRLTYSKDYSLAGFSAPVGAADHWRLAASYSDLSNDEWAWFLGGRAEAGVVEEVLPWDELSFGGSLGLTLRASEDLALELSLDAFDRPESDLRLIPLALVEWSMTDSLHLGRVGGGYGLDYQFDPRTNYFVAVDYVERAFRLNGDDMPPDGLLRDQERSVRLGLLWQPKEAIQLELFAGAADRHLVLFDGSTDLASFDVEGAPFFGFRLLFGKGSIF